MRGNPLFARFLLGIAVLMMLVPTFLYLGGPLRHPLITQGDKIEARSCPDCEGTGKIKEKSCRRCSGTGFIDFLIPGPNRPSYVVGHLYAPDGSKVTGANVQVDTGAGISAMQSDEQGQFGITLPPGSYGFKVRGQSQKNLVVAPLITPAAADRDLAFPRLDTPFAVK